MRASSRLVSALSGGFNKFPTADDRNGARRPRVILWIWQLCDSLPSGKATVTLLGFELQPSDAGPLFSQLECLQPGNFNVLFPFRVLPFTWHFTVHLTAVIE